MNNLVLVSVFGLAFAGILEAKEVRIPMGSINVNQLHTELLVAFPTWKGTPRPQGGFENPLLGVQSTDAEIILTVPDQTDEGVIQAVISAHIPKPPAPDADEELEAAIQSATTLAELKAALLGKTRQGKVKATRP